MGQKEPVIPGKQTSPVRISTPPRESQPPPRKVTPPRSPAKPVKSVSTPPPPKTPDHPLSPEIKRKTPKSPDKAARRASLGSQPSPFDPKAGEKTPNSKSTSTLKQRILSTPKSSAPSREVKTPEDLKWAIKTLSKKEVIQARVIRFSVIFFAGRNFNLPPTFRSLTKHCIYNFVQVLIENFWTQFKF